MRGGVHPGPATHARQALLLRAHCALLAQELAGCESPAQSRLILQMLLLEVLQDFYINMSTFQFLKLNCVLNIFENYHD
jgi:hypothetical protein